MKSKCKHEILMENRELIKDGYVGNLNTSVCLTNGQTFTIYSCLQCGKQVSIWDKERWANS